MLSKKGQPLTPTLDKIAAIQKESQAIGEFLDWLLFQEGCRIASYETTDEGEEELVPQYQGIEIWLAQYYNIDADAAERERRAMLEWIRREE